MRGTAEEQVYTLLGILVTDAEFRNGLGLRGLGFRGLGFMGLGFRGLGFTVQALLKNLPSPAQPPSDS